MRDKSGRLMKGYRSAVIKKSIAVSYYLAIIAQQHFCKYS